MTDTNDSPKTEEHVKRPTPTEIGQHMDFSTVAITSNSRAQQ